LAKNASNEYAICYLGGLTTIVKAMTTHKEDLSVQKVGISAINSLLSTPEDKYAIITAGGRKAIFDAMEHFQTNAEFQEGASLVVGRLLH
jgi:hypothetical protein